MLTYTLKVEQVRTETSDTVTICFKQPGLKKIKYQAGQYLTLIFRINGRRYIRPYSFSSAPGVDSFLEVTVKRVNGGLISNHINDQIRIGDFVEVMEPMGEFVFDESQVPGKDHVVLWGAGSGITPLISIAKLILNFNPDFHVTLAYGNKTYESVIFLDLINKLQQQFGQRFATWHFHTKLIVQEANPFYIQGRIQPSKVLEVMKKEGLIQNTVHFICGPSGLKESVREALSEIGVNSEFIFSEDFEQVKDPKDFEDITTRYVTIQRDGVDHIVEVVKSKSILEAGLDSLIDLSYSCQTGHCTICKGKVKVGKVKTVGLLIKNDSLAEDECLMCCAYPLTDDVKIVALN